MGNLESKLLAACLKSRSAWERASKVAEPSTFTPYNAVIHELIGEYYTNDSDAKSVDSDWLIAKIEAKFSRNDKHKDMYTLHAKEVIGCDVSAVNLLDLLVDVKREALGNELALCFINKQNTDKIPELMAQYQELCAEVLTENDAEIEEEYHNVSLAEVIQKTLNPDSLIKVAPAALNEALDGGVLPGHHLIIYARPETGKTASVLTMIWGFISQGLPGIYFGNEDPMLQIMQRAMSCITGYTKQELGEKSTEAQAKLARSGWDLIRFIPLTPGTPRDIEKYVKRYKPKWIVVDQIRNLTVPGAGNRVQELEEAAKAVRRMGQRYGAVTCSVTQAGDSADNKLVLGMGDIDSSNTGIPGQADVMIGIGVNTQYEETGMRMVSLPKNKISGKHVHFPIRINPIISRTENV